MKNSLFLKKPAIAFVQIFILFVLLSSSPRVLGQDNNMRKLESRIAELEQIVSLLQQRIDELEAIVEGRKEKVQVSGAVKGNWRELRNWRQLRRGMTMQQVEDLLGEPETVQVSGSLTFWYWSYPGGPRVTFDRSNRVYGWSEPSR